MPPSPQGGRTPPVNGYLQKTKKETSLPPWHKEGAMKPLRELSGHAEELINRRHGGLEILFRLSLGLVNTGRIPESVLDLP